MENLKIEKTRVEAQHAQFSMLNSQLLLQGLERANLFIIPLDNQRRWYRYHHLFADLLRQRLYQSVAASREGWRGRVTPTRQPVVRGQSPGN